MYYGNAILLYTIMLFDYMLLKWHNEMHAFRRIARMMKMLHKLCYGCGWVDIGGEHFAKHHGEWNALGACGVNQGVHRGAKRSVRIVHPYTLPREA